MQALQRNNKPQCIIVTGESGAGKTVITQHLTQFICYTNPNHEYIMKHADIAAKLLDIFGNAETSENFNSSRFIKFLQVLQEINIKYTRIHLRAVE